MQRVAFIRISCGLTKHRLTFVRFPVPVVRRASLSRLYAAISAICYNVSVTEKINSLKSPIRQVKKIANQIGTTY